MKATYSSCTDANGIELAHILTRRLLLEGEGLLIVGSPPGTYDDVMRPWRKLVEWRHWPSSEAGRHDRTPPSIPNGVGLVLITKAMSVDRSHAVQAAARDKNIHCLFGINSVSVLKRIIGEPPDNYIRPEKPKEDDIVPTTPPKFQALSPLGPPAGTVQRLASGPAATNNGAGAKPVQPDERVTRLRELFQEAHAALDLALEEAERVLRAAATDAAAAKKYAQIQELLKG